VFIEALTYQHYGHVDWREDIDVGIYRSESDLKIWKGRDPIHRLEEALREAKIVDENELLEIKLKININIESAWKKALQDLEPETDSLFEFIYKD
jgi:pyruvate dehydrogenase E1 component alpha subunit